MARRRRWKEVGKFGRCDRIRCTAAVLGAVAGPVVWFTDVPSAGNELPGVLIGVAITAASLPAVLRRIRRKPSRHQPAAITAASLPAALAVGVALFGKTKGRLLPEEIRTEQHEMLARQDEIIRHLRIMAEAVVKAGRRLAKAAGPAVWAGAAATAVATRAASPGGCWAWRHAAFCGVTVVRRRRQASRMGARGDRRLLVIL